MQQIAIRGGAGPADALYIETAPLPEPGPGEVRIRVAAAGVNRPDLVQREGRYPPPPGASSILGLEVAGYIDALGAGVTRWSAGQPVCALLSGGGYAEAVVVAEGQVLPVPEGLSLIEAAALPETAFTVYANVFADADLKAGETFMVHGANSGIGVMALQMARAVGARSIATVRGADKAEALKGLGADLVIDTTATDFVAAARDFGGVDVILDMLGGDVTGKNLETLKTSGRLVQIAFLTGARATIDLSRVMLKRLRLSGSTLRSRPMAEKAALARAVESTVWPWVSTGLVRPVIERTYPLRAAAEAHKHLEQGGHLGKIVLTTD
ncbi:MAG: NAD(P)H-quinone oxidoreductase [Asticcacaulis sp.]